MDILKAFNDYFDDAKAAMLNAASEADLEQARIEFLGQKKGKLRNLQALVGKAPKEEKPLVGKKFNEVRTEVTALLEARQQELSTASSSDAVSDFDPTLPGHPPTIGNLHPITKTITQFREIMGRFGFTVVEGPEIEDERHNFDALNIPNDHPARDPLDNFYVATAKATAGGPILLRSQTSTVQIRTMEQVKPPVRIVSLGRVYRPDTMDATHSCMFHQMEGLMVDTDVTMAQLKTVLSLFARSFLGPDVEIRFRPSFFPFTEPSVEVDMKWGDSWMEIGGAGMVDPNVFKAVGYDPDKVSGFAFGLGIERFCMKNYEVDDIRRFYENDVRFLNQF
ncbi:Phenylalanine--tRNA ligase alpha subunit [Fuerstiella marisgermanici]|uniref:Phenylalanine--tRNA ligase alpha subunit n=1 Tax=Fuerstiella marisgermanici TaxID=1891926 RepID=A0A1P8WSE6_9PLAN|nr:phenylalanine--tRNA ligase subunit alpha [Fuerstiella marisgermanici]APZ96961.1 Phenylalanine--tRNA ligase alpha subunit [Fuerstiella marisgermanici]